MNHVEAQHANTLCVVISTQGVSHWQQALLTRLQQKGVTLVAVVLEEQTPPKHFFSALIDLIDQRLFPGADSASGLQHPDVSTLFSEHCALADINSAASVGQRAQSALNLSRASDNQVASALGIPVLSLQPSAHADWRDTPVGLWECLAGEPVVGLRVARTSADGNADTALSATECTDPVSVGRTRHAALWAGCELLYHALTGATDTPDGPALPRSHADSRGKPSAWTALVVMPWHTAKGLFRKLARRNQLRQWIVLWQRRADSLTDHDFSTWQHILPPRDVFWADPFVIERDSRQYLFIEEATFTPRRGHLSVMELNDDGSTSDPVVILKKPYHLSYPNVFEHDGSWYMMPESGEAKCLQIYECHDWPHGWQWHSNPIEDTAVYDGTLLNHNGKWWLFGTVQHFEDSSPNVFLHLWHADSPLGPWTPHVANPICTDVTRARPAGKLFVQDGVLYRPSQNCGTRYGFGLQLNRVEHLTESAYSETTVNHYTPWSASIDAVHTLNSSDTHLLADAVLWRSPSH